MTLLQTSKMIGLCLNKGACDAVAEQTKVLTMLLPRLHMPKTQVCSQNHIAMQERESVVLPASI